MAMTLDTNLQDKINNILDGKTDKIKNEINEAKSRRKQYNKLLFS